MRENLSEQLKMPWEHFPHIADMGIRGVGRTKNEAFEEAAKALVALTTDIERVSPKEKVEVSLSASDDEQLLVEWLDAVVFEMAIRLWVFSRFEARIEANKLEGVLWGEPFDEARHTVGVEVKGPTFTELHVGLRGDGLWVAQLVVDV
jgi:tRNA nucleotidyltransferase (CCA-adding enzyme)